jgi:hypothetical protein
MVMGVYRTALRLFPADYTFWFGREMLVALEMAGEEHRRRGWAAYVGHVSAELTGLVAGAAREWIAKLIGDKAARDRALPDWRMMRPAGVPSEVWFAGQPCSLDTMR